MQGEWHFDVVKYKYDSAAFFLNNGKAYQCHGKVTFRDWKGSIKVVGLGKTQHEARLDAENASKKVAHKKVVELKRIAEQQKQKGRK